MATTKDPITQQTGDIGAQNETAYQQDVLGAQKRAKRMAEATGTNQTNIVNRAVVSPTAPITPADLQPKAPVTVPTVPTPTTASSVTGRAESILENELLRQQRDAEAKAKQSEGDLMSLQSDILGVQQSRGDIEKGLKVDELSKMSNDAFTALQASQRAQTKAIRELEKNPRGLFGGALEQEKNRINREYAMEQADLSIAYDVANRNYTSASQAADRKIALALEPLKTKLDFQSKFYEVNQNNLSKAQQNTLQALIAKNEREYESEQSRLKTLEDTKLKALFEAQTNGADPVTLTNIQRAQTPEEAIIAGGEFIGAQQRFENDLRLMQYNIDRDALNLRIEEYRKSTDPNFDGYLDEKETAKIDASPQGKKVKLLGDLKQKLQNYKSLVEQFGTETPLGGQKSVLDAAYSDLKIAYKTAAELGALTGPDVTLLEQAIKPASFSGVTAPLQRIGAVITRQGKGSIIAGIDQSLNVVDQNAKSNIEQLLSRDPRYNASFYVNELITPFKDAFLPKNIEEFINASPDNLNKVKELRQRYPDYTEQDYMQILQPTSFNNVGGDTNKPTSMKSGMRTDRHNNPAAFTTDIAKNAGLREGIDYEVGDPFSGGKYHTARLLGDPVAQTIKVIDNIGFYTQSGKPRWTYISKIPEAKNWSKLSYDQKKKVIAKMYSHEGGTQLKSLFA